MQKIKNIITRGKSQRNEEGFTLIELLVVILIIGILAAIAIPVFLNQRQTANDGAVQSDVRNTADAIETYFVNNPNAEFPTAADIRAMVKKSQDVQISIMGKQNDWCITGSHPNGKKYPGGGATASFQPYLAYSNTLGGLGTINDGISTHSCYNYNRSNL